MSQDINIIGIVFFFAGIAFLIRNIIFYLKPGSLKNYMEKSPKALIWRSKFGIEKTVKFGKFIFLPLGIIVSIMITIFGFKAGILPLF